MEQLKAALLKSLEENILQMVISNPKEKGGVTKIKVRPVYIKNELFYQKELFENNQVFHQNLTAEELMEHLSEAIESFRQLQWSTKDCDYQALISKKGKVSLIKKRKKCEDVPVSMEQFSHNRKKNYLLNEGSPIDFLVELDVMTKDGKVHKNKYDKFRQINRFLEFVEDVADRLPKGRELTILDFGCGKSYLTFALYYYLREMKKRDLRIIGLDLKKDVIARCNALKDKLHYDKLQFLTGDIADYTGVDEVDMVVTLHACDTATDYALAKAVKWNAKVILSVPCCQHELNKTLKNDVLEPVLGYGLIKERMAALITDAMRGQLLEQHGYQVQIMEFIDMEHTPKNILIRAVQKSQKEKESAQSDGKKERYETCRDFLHADLTLEKLL